MLTAGYDHEDAGEAVEAAFQEFGDGKDHLTLSDYRAYVAGGLLLDTNQVRTPAICSLSFLWNEWRIILHSLTWPRGCY